MPNLLGVTNPVPGHESTNINRNMPTIPNDPRVQNATDPTRVSGPDNRTERQDSGDAAGSERTLRYDSNFLTFLQRLSETPGLGQKVKDDAFQGQFSGMAAEAFTLDDIDAVTGATISSRAATTAINAAIEVYQSLQFDGKGA